MINEATFVEQGQLVAFEHNGDEVLGIIGKQRKGNLLQITFSAAVNDGFVHTKNSVETKERSIFVPSERLFPRNDNRKGDNSRTNRIRRKLDQINRKCEKMLSLLDLATSSGGKKAIRECLKRAHEVRGALIEKLRSRVPYFQGTVQSGALPNDPWVPSHRYCNYFFRLHFHGPVNGATDSSPSCNTFFRATVTNLTEHFGWKTASSIENKSVLVRGNQLLHVTLMESDSDLQRFVNGSAWSRTAPHGCDIVMFCGASAENVQSEVEGINAWSADKFSGRILFPIILLPKHNDHGACKDGVSILSAENFQKCTAFLVSLFAVTRNEIGMSHFQENAAPASISNMSSQLHLAERLAIFRGRSSLLPEPWTILPEEMRVMFNNTDSGLEAFYNPSDNRVQAVWPDNIPSRRARQLASNVACSGGKGVRSRTLLPNLLPLLVEAELRGWGPYDKDGKHQHWGPGKVSSTSWITEIQARLMDRPELLRNFSTKGNPIDELNRCRKIYDILALLVAQSSDTGEGPSREKDVRPNLIGRAQIEMEAQSYKLITKDRQVLEECVKGAPLTPKDVTQSLATGNSEDEDGGPRVRLSYPVENRQTAWGTEGAKITDVRALINVDQMEPSVMENLKKIVSIDLRDQQLTSFPIKRSAKKETKVVREALQLEWYKHLLFLDVSKNMLVTLHPISSMSLVSLNLSHNRLRRLPTLLLPNLEVFDVSHNLLRGRVDFALGIADALTSDKTVKRGKVRIFKNLGALDLSNNHFSWELEGVHLAANTLSRSMPVLQNLFLHCNPFVSRVTASRKAVLRIRSMFVNCLPQLKAFTPPCQDSKVKTLLHVQHSRLSGRVWMKPGAESNIDDVSKIGQARQGTFCGIRNEYMGTESIAFTKNGSVHVWGDKNLPENKPSHSETKVIVETEDHAVALYAKERLLKEIQTISNNLEKNNAVPTSDSTAALSPMIKCAKAIDQINLRRAFQKLYTATNAASNMRRVLKKVSIARMAKVLSRIAYINRMQQMVPSSQTEAMVADAFRTWKIVDTRAKCVVQAAYRVKGFQTVQKMRAMKTVIKLLRRRKSDILGCVFARLKFATGAVVMLSKTESKRKALESLETTKAETKKIRSNTNHMMRRFRSNFNEKANIIEELLQERQQLDKIKRDTEIMRLKADELAQKIRDWESGKRTSDFLHYENVETMTARGKPSQNNMVVELI
eukprot:g430.t1